MTRSEHLLVCLAEESSEVVKAVTKVLRFGLHGSHPDYCSGMTNIDVVRHELHDLIAVMEIVGDDVWDMLPIDRALIEQKKTKVLKFIQYAKENGDIE